jgi:hypothetical protein
MSGRSTLCAGFQSRSAAAVCAASARASGDPPAQSMTVAARSSFSPCAERERRSVPRREAGQLELGRHPFPAAGEPGSVRRHTPGDHDERLVWQRGQQAAAEIAVECGHLLIGVDEHDRAVLLPGAR